MLMWNEISRDELFSNPYENLPNFLGGLYIEEGELKLKQPTGNIVSFGKPSEISYNQKLIELMLENIYEHTDK